MICMRAVSRIGNLGIGLALLLQSMGIAWAEPQAERRDMLIHQKLLLLDNFLDSPAMRELRQNGAAAVKSGLHRASKLRDAAHNGLVSGDEQAAEKAVDEALRAASAAATAGRRTLPEVQHARNADLVRQVHDYSAAIAEALQLQGRNQDARLGRPEHDARLAGLDRMLDEAASLTASARHGEANRVLASAYRIAVSALSELRAGETMVLELKFATPADEYAYEQRRNQSHAMLMDIQLQDGLAEGVNRTLIQRYLEENRQLRSRAETEAGAGDYKAAITSLENATGQLVRALRLSGMLIF